jgi:pimeloyl-ACP methyl ester carboxylesterase
VTDFVTSRDGTRIAYEIAGDGPALILVDGAFCYREFGPMRKLAALLSRSFRVICYDRRARGESGDTRPYAMEREVEDIDALLGVVGGHAHLYGISSGAALALAAAATRFPIDRVALYEPPFMVGPHARRDLPSATERHNVLTRMLEADRRGDAVKYYMCDVIGMPRFMTAIFQFLPMWKKLKSVATSLPYDSAIMGNFSLPLELASKIKVPTLVMHGSKTWPVLGDAARATATAVPVGHHHVLDGQTHNVNPAVLAPVLSDFFRS